MICWWRASGLDKRSWYNIGLFVFCHWVVYHRISALNNQSEWTACFTFAGIIVYLARNRPLCPIADGIQSLGMQMSQRWRGHNYCTRRKPNIKFIQKLQDRGSLDIYDESRSSLPVAPYTDLLGSVHNARNLGWYMYSYLYSVDLFCCFMVIRSAKYKPLLGR